MGDILVPWRLNILSVYMCVHLCPGHFLSWIASGDIGKCHAVYDVDNYMVGCRDMFRACYQEDF